jgi:excinuclease ABC subunit A
MILSPIIKDRKGEHQQIFEDARKAGFVRVRVDGHVRDLSEEFDLEKNKRHTIEVVIDRLVTEERGGDGSAASAARLSDSVEVALKLGGGAILVAVESKKKNDEWDEQLYSEHFACVQCGFSLSEIAPRNFSFNSPHGACPACTGLGVHREVDPDLVVSNKNLSLADGAIQPWRRATSTSTWHQRVLEALAEKHGFSLTTPVSKLAKKYMELVLYGDKTPITLTYTSAGGHENQWDTTFEGCIPNLQRRYKETDSDHVRGEIERYMAANPCPACEGTRLKAESRAVTIDGNNVIDITRMSVVEAQQWAARLMGPKTPLNKRGQLIAAQILKEIGARLDFMIEVGLDYLTLDRATGTLSGGEAQRIRLATQIGSGLMGVLYVCDEPTIGLHPADDDRLIRTLQRLRDLGNTVLIVEHDESMMRAADWIVDMGPGAGENGGEVVAEGPLSEILKSEASITGAYLSGRKQIPIPTHRREGNGRALVVRGARENNLKNIDVRFPLGCFIGVTGVSGSGKSSLVSEILYKKAAQLLYGARDRPGACDDIDGLELIDKVVNIDQSPIGRTPRSNPATYTGTFTPIREMFASVPEARTRGYKPGRFSFNVKGGRCEACSGDGYTEIEMHFLPDVTVPCEVCEGKRYNREALEILFRGKHIADVLNMTVHEALDFYSAFPKVRNKLQTMQDVGLGYIRLGQPATTLSGGEAQRIKLSTELSRRSTGRTLYILDEPTTGLSFEDTNALLSVLQRLVDSGNTVVVIEHHMDVIKNFDHIIDLGPAGGFRGGEIIAEGTPEEIVQSKTSQTGVYLRRALGMGRNGRRNGSAAKTNAKPARKKTAAKAKS